MTRAQRQNEKTAPPELPGLSVPGRAGEDQPRRLQFGWIHGLTTTAVIVLAVAIYHFQLSATDPLQPTEATTASEPLRQADEPVVEPERRGSRQSKNDTDADQRIDEILALKRAGDDAWRDALRDFIETYPDYPLPEELKP